MVTRAWPQRASEQLHADFRERRELMFICRVIRAPSDFPHRGQRRDTDPSS